MPSIPSLRRQGHEHLCEFESSLDCIVSKFQDIERPIKEREKEKRKEGRKRERGRKKERKYGYVCEGKMDSRPYP